MRTLVAIVCFCSGLGIGVTLQPEPVSAHGLSTRAQDQLDQSWSNNDLWGVPVYTSGQEPTCTAAGEGAIAMIDGVLASCDGTTW